MNMKEIKIVAFSDIHGYLLDNLPEGDIALIAGDICPVHGSHSPTAQYYWLQNKFIPWCYELLNSNKFKHICFCGGNHDFIFETIITNSTQYFIKWPENVHYLFDDMVEIEGVKIYGTPWTPVFCNWAFMAKEKILHNYFLKIPEKLDILLAHGPVYGYNDTIIQYPERTEGRDSHLGSKSLLHRIKEVRPKWYIHGHIHSGNHNIEKVFHNMGDLTAHTNSVNVSILDENYHFAYDPFQFSIIKE